MQSSSTLPVRQHAEIVNSANSAELSAAHELLAVPSSFLATVQAFPDNVNKALALLDSVSDVSALLAQANTLDEFAHRVKADTKAINCIQEGKLKIEAKLGSLLTRGEPGRGKRKPDMPCPVFSNGTTKAIRKVADNSGRIDEYFRRLREVEDPIEASRSGFLQFVGSDGNIKAHQNRGVIEWYTPAKYVEAARKVMGSIDVDPASSVLAQRTVNAGTFYDATCNGLEKDWPGNVFLNPPFRSDLAKKSVGKLVESTEQGVTTQAILLTNNNTDTEWWHQAASACCAICFTKGRVAFYSPAGDTASPTNGHTFFYFGKRRTVFVRVFSALGMIMEVAT